MKHLDMELENLKRVFTALDVRKDGVVTSEEIFMITRTASQPGDPARDLQARDLQARDPARTFFLLGPLLCDRS